MSMPKPLAKGKEYWSKQPKSKKKAILTIAGIVVALIVIAIVVSIALNASKPGYKVLYSGLDSTETSEVYAAVQELGVQPQINGAGEITVPSERYDDMLLQLAARGYPKSAMPYDIFYDHSSMTSTELDRKTSLLYQLQDRLQATLKRMDAVSDAVVTLNVPDQSQYVWQQATQNSDSTASVLLTLKQGKEIGADQVNAIKNLVAAATPRLEPKNVIVTDSATGMELQGEGDTTSLTNSKTLEYEKMVQSQIEDNILRLLSPTYGSNGVVAVAKVSLDFDKMVEESRELTRPADGKDAIKHQEHNYATGGNQPIGGLVGEENNTDIPNYPNLDGNGGNGTGTSYGDITDIEYGYILKQIEKGQPLLKSASISVKVNDANLNANRNELIDQISKATQIEAADISLAALNPPTVPTPTPEPEPEPANDLWSMIKQYWLYIAIGGGILLLLIIGLIVFLSIRHAKKKASELAAAAQAEVESRTQDMEEEIEEYKRQLEDAARAKMDTKDAAITDEVRSFAKENPEITANLIRSWLKEDEK